MRPSHQKVPTGDNYILSVFNFGSLSKLESDANVDVSDPRLSSIGNSLSALYQIATCNPVCRGGRHLLEALAGRAHNHGCGSLILLSSGLYDESLNLTRSIAEIVNLLFLFRIQPSEFGDWVSGSRKARMQRFAPAVVRKKIKNKKAPLPISDSWYRELCESATHPTPGVLPNAHSTEEGFPGIAGGMFQEAGYEKCIFQLSYVLAMSAFISASLVNRAELLGLVEEGVDAHIEFLVSRNANENADKA